jgi:L-lactate dehydrogenase (cytochrome)
MDDDHATATTGRRDWRAVNIHEIRKLVRVKPPGLGGPRRRLARCHDIGDLRHSARKVIPQPVFDYVDGGADEELSLAANTEAFRRWRFVPRALADVTAVDTTGQVLGTVAPLPLVLAPTGFTRMMHPDGEIAAARSATRHGLPYTLSTMATTSIADLAAAVQGDLWFQLYIMADGGLTTELVDRAAACGYRVLVVAVDTVVAGRRVRDVRNGLTIPPELSVRALASIGSRPAYWLRMLRSPAMEFANLAIREPMTIADTAGFFHPGITWDDIAALRERWAGQLVIKGPLGAADARRAIETGADGVQLSNHGGRQLDRAVAPIDLLPTVRDAVGPDPAVLVDSGVRHGADIATAVALGADAAAIGRAYLYGLMTAGEQGVDKALDLLAAQYRRTLQLLGVTSAAELRKHSPELLLRS